MNTLDSNIYLVGLPGSGKSTLGRELAKLTGKKFIDLDAFIEETEHQTIAELFTLRGETYFREAERRCLQTLSIENNLVVATGGGAACFHSNMELMNTTGRTVFLNVPLISLYSRLKAQQAKGMARPLIDGKSETDIQKSLEEMAVRRIPFYSIAHYTFTGDNIKAKEVYEVLKTQPDTGTKN